MTECGLAFRDPCRRVTNPSHFDVDISAVYSCTGDGCGFRFDQSNARRDVGGGFAEVQAVLRGLPAAPLGEDLRFDLILDGDCAW
jgi:hypothetical protein